MASNTHGAAQWHKDKSEETESQDYTVDTDTYMWGAHESATSLIFSVKQDEADNNNERLSDAEFTVKEKELEHYAGLAQK